MREAINIDSIIKGMQDNFGGDNASQMKGLQLLKGLATSNDPKANKFMKALNKATTTISKDILGETPKKESLIIKGKGQVINLDEEYDLELKEGKEYILLENK